MKRYSKLILGLILTITASSFAGCATKTKTTPTESTQPATVDMTKVTGTVNYAVWNQDDATKAVVAKFIENYPNVKVNLSTVVFPVSTYLTTLASAGNLPDVIEDWQSSNFPVSQGWIQPLDKYLKADPETQYLPDSFLSAYKMGGETYAVPRGLQFNGVIVNLDLLDQLNLDKPKYDWTIDDFKALVKKGATDETAGIDSLAQFQTSYLGMLNKNLSGSGLNIKTGKFDFTSGTFAKSIALEKELHAVPGLVADDLKNKALTDAGKPDDYEKKFGKGADPRNAGKILTALDGTWGGWWFNNVTWKMDVYPLPQDPAVGYRGTIHCDHAFMTTTAKDKQASFELLKFISYGKVGNLERLKLGLEAKDATGKATPGYFIPSTTDPDVVKAFKAETIVPGGVKYMYDHMDKGFRADQGKFIPDFGKAYDEIITPTVLKVISGSVDSSAVASDMENRANAVLAAGKNTFDILLKNVQAKEAK